MGAPKGAPVSPPSTINSTALMYDESSEARKSTALARSSGSPQRASETVEEKKSETFADSSAAALARAPRFQMGVFVAPGPPRWDAHSSSKGEPQPSRYTIFTIPLRTLLIVHCQPVVFESTTYVRGDAAGGSRIEPSVRLVRSVPEWLEKGARALCV
jgi:hypothetical protein